MENNCIRYSNGSCLDGDFVSKCVGMDCCGAYEPALQLCRDCKYYRGEVCVVHSCRIDENAYCSHWTSIDGDYSEELTHISVAHLSEVLDKCVEVGYINEYGKHRIIELVKKEI